MKTVVVGFSRPKHCTLLSKLIMKLQGTNYSHVYLMFYSESLDRKLIYQASGLQVNFVGSQLFYEHHIAVKEFELSISDEAYKKALQFAVDKAGSPYSIKQLFRILWYSTTGHLTQGDGRQMYVCSELVAQMLLEDFGLDVNKDLDLVTPKDLFELMSDIYG